MTMNRLPDGTTLTSMHEAMKAMARYIDLAEQHRIDDLHKAIEEDAQTAAMTMEIIFGTAIILGTVFRKETGRSLLPVFRKAAQVWQEQLDQMIGRLF